MDNGDRNGGRLSPIRAIGDALNPVDPGKLFEEPTGLCRDDTVSDSELSILPSQSALYGRLGVTGEALGVLATLCCSKLDPVHDSSIADLGIERNPWYNGAMPTEITPLEMLIGETHWIHPGELGATLRANGCTNHEMARRDFEDYGVAKFAKYTGCGCHGRYLEPHEVRRLDD